MSCGSRQPGTPWAPQLLPTRSHCWRAEKTEVGPGAACALGEHHPPLSLPERPLAARGVLAALRGRGSPLCLHASLGRRWPTSQQGLSAASQEQPDGPADRQGVRQEAGGRPLCCRQTQWGLGGATRLVSAEQSRAGGVASIRFSRFINCRAVVHPGAPAPGALTPEVAGKPPRSWAQGRCPGHSAAALRLRVPRTPVPRALC